ncbi:MAG: polysaccharide biosynthesis tyrosine autokinase, partial [Planctomycetaceae bacterium]
DREVLLMTLDKAGNPVVGGGAPQAGQLVSMMLEEQLLLDNHGPDHPKVKAIRRRIELIRGQDLGAAEPEKSRDVFEVYVESLEKQLRSTQEREKYLDNLFAEEQEASKSQELFQLNDETFNKSIDRKQQLFDTIIARLEELSLNKDQSGFDAQTLDAASGAWQVGPDFAQNLTMAGLLGALVGLGLGYVLELADRSYHSPDEIVRELEIPVVGHIPVIAENQQTVTGDSRLHWSLSTVHHPKSRVAEAYRGVRTAIYFNAQDTQHQVIQVTSPNPGDGKSTLAVNLAVSIANSGKSVLILDCDLRRPRVAKMLGIKDGIGLQAAIVGDAELTDLPQETGVPNLQAIVSTDKPENPSELLTSPAFQDSLEVFRTKYDYVILDSPPTLAVTDPGIIAARVDGVILTIRLTKKSRQHSRQSMEILNSIGATVIGVVVNGIGDRSGYGGYGRNTYYTYGKYRYGYAYGYGYGYGYGSGYGSYYADDKSKQKKRRQARDQAKLGITQSTSSTS